MQLIAQERVQQALRHLQPADEAKVMKALDHLQSMGPDGLRHSSKTAKRAGTGEALFVYKATPRLRILFRYKYKDEPSTPRDEPTLIIEDIVSHDLLEKHFSSREVQ
ncbi:MAG: hypothetical protein ACLQU1_27980 [Bryobacteraceae bacterium]